MKMYVGLSLWFVLSIVALGQQNPASNAPGGVAAEGSQAGPQVTPMKSDQPRVSSREAAPVETFAQAFEDPNLVIGVFERVSAIATLASGQMLARLPGYADASKRFALEGLRCTQPIKGSFSDTVVFATGLSPINSEGEPRTPPFIDPFGSRWVLALEKTTDKTRVSRFGQEITKYAWLNDRTMFRVFWSGYGTLCLRWPKDDPKKPEPKPEYLVQVPETMVGDFEAIARVMPNLAKAKMDPNEAAAIDKVKKDLKTDLARSILARIQADKAAAPQDAARKAP